MAFPRDVHLYFTQLSLYSFCNSMGFVKLECELAWVRSPAWLQPSLQGDREVSALSSESWRGSRAVQDVSPKVPVCSRLLCAVPLRCPGL